MPAMAQTFRIVLISEKSGKTYSVKVQPGIVIAALLFSVVLIGAVAFSGVGFFMMLQKHKALKASHENLERTVQRLRSEQHASEPLATGTRAEQEDVLRHSDRLSENHTTAQKKSPVEVDALKVRRCREPQELWVSFLLINRVGKERVSGYVWIVAQKTDVTPSRCALWPEGELVRDMPADYRKGSPFSIVRRKRVSGSLSLPEDAPGYNKLIVIIYDQSGGIITKQEYSLDPSSCMARKS